MIDSVFQEKLAPVTAQLSVLRVTVAQSIVDGELILTFDGRNTYDDPSEWDSYWISFRHYVNFVLSTYRMLHSAVKYEDMDSPAMVRVNFGTLFDMLKRDYSNE